MSKNKNNRDGLVFSTDPDFFKSFQEEEQDDSPEISPAKQKLRVWLDRKQRKGKEVTLIAGFAGPESGLEELAKWLKTKCGVGGSAKDGEIILQGDHRDKVVKLLLEKGYSQTKKAGG
ncbi:MAG: translation initiation factor [Saprospiraceae bacterium]|nr:translation initiation factor [Saprospiraceae bacterium]